MEKKEKEASVDILTALEDYIPPDNSRKWAKLQSTITYRRLSLMLLREIVGELRRLNDRK